MYLEHYEKNLPILYKKAQIEDFQISHPQLVAFAKEWTANPTSLFIHGKFGVGKTHFVHALVRRLLNKYFNHWPLFYSSPNLDALLLEAIKSEQGDRYLIKKVCEADILIIDDVGRETNSDRLRRQFFEIIDYRYTQCKPTIMTSNYSPETFHIFFDGAIISRIQGWSFVEITGKDRRAELHFYGANS